MDDVKQRLSPASPPARPPRCGANQEVQRFGCNHHTKASTSSGPHSAARHLPLLSAALPAVTKLKMGTSRALRASPQGAKLSRGTPLATDLTSHSHTQEPCISFLLSSSSQAYTLPMPCLDMPHCAYDYCTYYIMVASALDADPSPPSQRLTVGCTSHPQARAPPPYSASHHHPSS